MIPFVKLHTRRFHVTSKVFLRKIIPKSSSSDAKDILPENNSDPSVNCENPFPDYLGIESDENVITVKPQNHVFKKPQTIDSREKFYRASFGIVRYDEDNKPKYHGQFRRKMDFTFPHSSSDKAKISDISEISTYKKQVHQDLTLKKSQKFSAVDNEQDINFSESFSSNKDHQNLNYVDECYFGASKIEDNTQNTASEELNYFDKDYFETLAHSQNTSVHEESIKKENSTLCTTNQVEELNYLEKDYFETLAHSQNTSFKQNTPVYEESIRKENSTLCNTNQVEELNYLKKDYFESLHNLKIQHVKQDSTDYSSPNLVQTDQSEELNYLEKDYFKVPSNSDSNYVNKIIESENKSHSTFNSDELNFIDKSFFENSSVSDIKNPANSDNLSKSSSYFVENTTLPNQEILNEGSERNWNGTIQNQSKVSNSVFTDQNIDELSKNQINKFNNKKLFSDKNTQYSPRNSNMSKDMQNDDELDRKFSVQSDFKFSNLVSEEPNESDPVLTATAHDFVEKLREEQKIPCQVNISKVSRKSLNEEKVDSKGFRILKNQVPNLAYYTHDEILTILKQNIVYSDDDLLVLNKPYSLVMHESKTTKEPCLSMYLDDLAKEMDKQSTNPQLFTVHRLDKETTGCLLLARNETMAMHLKALFAQRKVVKKYWVITAGVPDPPEGVIDIPISEGSIKDRKRMVLHPKLPDDVQYKNHSKKGKAAVTTYKVIGESGNAALVEVFPKTGIKHQIRVHFGFGLGCPILGDHKYSHLDKLAPQKLPADMLQRLYVRQSKVRYIPMHIHAKSVGIADYFTDGRDLFVNIPIPDYFKLNLKRLKFRKKDLIY